MGSNMGANSASSSSHTASAQVSMMVGWRNTSGHSTANRTLNNTMITLNRIGLLAAAVSVLMASLGGQVQAPQTAVKDADAIWNEILQKSRPGSGIVVRVEKDKASAESKFKISQQADLAWQTSIQARGFYSQYPGHAQAGEARKLEAMAAVLSIRDNNPDHEQSALTIATLYRGNPSIPTADRCEVALAQERYLLSQKVKGKLAKGSVAEQVAIASKLQAEFGDQPALQAYLLEVARRADLSSAAAIVDGVARSAKASAAVQDEARSIAARAAMIGRPLNLKLSRLDGGELEFGRKQESVTALVVWSPDHSASIEALQSIQANLPHGVQVVFVALGGDTNSIRRAQASIRTPGQFCLVGKGAPARTVANSLNLKYAPVPYVFIVNRDGKVSAMGRVREIPSLLVKTLG
jgi:hypothetical protein